MDDITNNLRTIGKSIDKRHVDIRFSIKELSAIKALCQNPHEAYQDNPELMETVEALFNSIKITLDYHSKN